MATALFLPQPIYISQVANYQASLSIHLRPRNRITPFLLKQMCVCLCISSNYPSNMHYLDNFCRNKIFPSTSSNDTSRSGHHNEQSIIQPPTQIMIETQNIPTAPTVINLSSLAAKSLYTCLSTIPLPTLLWTMWSLNLFFFSSCLGQRYETSVMFPTGGKLHCSWHILNGKLWNTLPDPWTASICSVLIVFSRQHASAFHWMTTLIIVPNDQVKIITIHRDDIFSYPISIYHVPCSTDKVS